MMTYRLTSLNSNQDQRMSIYAVPLNSISDSVVIPYPDSYSGLIGGFAVISLASHVVAFCLQLLLFYSIFRQKLRAIPADTQIILSIIGSDMIGSIYAICAISTLVCVGGFDKGQLGCRAEAGIYIYTFGVSIGSVLLLTMNRYLAVIHSFNLSERSIRIFMASLWIFLAAIIAGIMLWSHFSPIDDIVSLQNCRLICFITGWSRSVHTMAAVIITLAFISCVCGFIVFAYSRIVYFYHQHHRDALQRKGDALNRPKTIKKMAQMERKLIVKSIAITLAFWICLLPILIKMAWEVITGEPVHVIPDAISISIAALNMIANPVILFFFDGFVRSSILDAWAAHHRKIARLWQWQASKPDTFASNQALPININKASNNNLNHTDARSADNGGHIEMADLSTVQIYSTATTRIIPRE